VQNSSLKKEDDFKHLSILRKHQVTKENINSKVKIIGSEHRRKNIKKQKSAPRQPTAERITENTH
jgi:hypothetical protein